MALKRYVGPNDEVTLVVAGTQIGTVRKDEGIVVPDELADLVEWSDELWQDGAPKKDASKTDAPAKDGK